MENKPENIEKNTEIKKVMTTAELTSFAFEIGYTISVPIIILVLGGRIIDKHFNTSPLFMISGLLISVFSTGYIIYKKVKKIT